MATEFSSKAAIFEHQGIEPLVRCLGSHDPDVQKNGIEALALLLMVCYLAVSYKIVCKSNFLSST